MSPGSKDRVARLLQRAGFVSMWLEFKSGAWGREIAGRLYVVGNAEDPDRVPDPRDVLLCAYVRGADGEWRACCDEWPVTLRGAIALVADARVDAGER